MYVGSLPAVLGPCLSESKKIIAKLKVTVIGMRSRQQKWYHWCIIRLSIWIKMETHINMWKLSYGQYYHCGLEEVIMGL